MEPDPEAPPVSLTEILYVVAVVIFCVVVIAHSQL
jgi:hypothetical protein